MIQNKKDFKEIYIGVDIAKDKFDVYIHPINQYLSISNNKQTITLFIKKIKKISKEYSIEESRVFIGMEATGIYHQELFKKLSLDTNYSVSVVNPKRVHNFFKSFGDIAKTDKKDARLIALFMERIKPIKSVYSNKGKQLKKFSTRRNQLVNSIKVQKNYLESYREDKSITNSITRTIKFLKQELKKIEIVILILINKDTALKEKKEVLESAPGIGTISAIALIACLPELGKLSSKEISSLIGVAPKNRDSGKFRGKRSIIGGRKVIRNTLYMSALTSIRVGNNIFANLYNRLREKGKCAKIAIVAVIRKLIITLNSMIKHNTKWKNVFLIE